jgi:hypothetical protein
MALSYQSFECGKYLPIFDNGAADTCRKVQNLQYWSTRVRSVNPTDAAILID